jgi:hypothetical protein
MATLSYVRHLIYSTLQVIDVRTLYSHYVMHIVPNNLTELPSRLRMRQRQEGARGGHLSETWHQTDSICFYTWDKYYKKGGYSWSTNFRYLMHNISLHFRIRRIIRRLGVIDPRGRQLDATFNVAFARTARVYGAHKRETDRARICGLRRIL